MLKTYIVKFKNNSVVYVKARSYIASGYGTYAFYDLTFEDLNKFINSGKVPSAVFEKRRSEIREIYQEGFVETTTERKVSVKNKKKPQAPVIHLASKSQIQG